MTTTDPVATVRDALERHDYAPHGKPYDFRARCPGHAGDNPDSLHVCEGVDRRAVLFCHAHGCTVEQIVTPIGLTVKDLFPNGHRNGHQRQPPTANRPDFTGDARVAVNTLAALERLGERWRVAISVDHCPYCGRPHAQLVVASWHDPFVHCEAACTARMFTGGLAGLLADQEEAA